LFVAPVRGEVDKYQVYAVRFATIANVRPARLVAGADAARRMDIAMMIWVLKGIDGRVAIMDSGSVSNLRAQDRMRSLASDPRLVIPGHDPAVFDRFPHVSERIVRIE
jgi:hypothetical protein